MLFLQIITALFLLVLVTYLILSKLKSSENLVIKFKKACDSRDAVTAKQLLSVHLLPPFSHYSISKFLRLRNHEILELLLKSEFNVDKNAIEQMQFINSSKELNDSVICDTFLFCKHRIIESIL